MDLYCEQGHFEKAKEVLNQVLKLNPFDKSARDRLKEIEFLSHPLDTGRPPIEETLDVISEEVITPQQEESSLEKAVEGPPSLLNEEENDTSLLSLREFSLIQSKLLKFQDLLKKRSLNFKH